MRTGFAPPPASRPCRYRNPNPVRARRIPRRYKNPPPSRTDSSPPQRIYVVGMATWAVGSSWEWNSLCLFSLLLLRTR